MKFPPVQELLAQTGSMLLVDRIISFRDGQIEVEKKVLKSDPVFLEHFPDFPVYPGVFLIEIMAQSSGLISRLEDLRSEGSTNLQIGSLAKVEAVRFKTAVKPGDCLRVKAKREKSSKCLTLFSASIVKDRELICSGRFWLSSQIR